MAVLVLLALIAGCGEVSGDASAPTTTRAATATTQVPDTTATTATTGQADAGIGPNTTLQHVTLVISDFAASERFYKEVLGLEEIPAEWLPERQMSLALGHNLELHVGEVPGVVQPNAFNHFAFSVNDLDAFLDHLKEQGVAYSSLGGTDPYRVVERPGGVRQTFFQDPDGYWNEVNDAQ